MSEQRQERTGSSSTTTSPGDASARPSSAPDHTGSSSGRASGSSPMGGGGSSASSSGVPRTSSSQARPAARPRRTRLSLRRVDPWSTMYCGFVWSLALAIALLVAVAVLYWLLDNAGVLGAVNQLTAELTAEAGVDPADVEPVVTMKRVLGIAAILALINVVLLTVLSAIGALLYNAVSSFTGGIEITLGDRD